MESVLWYRHALLNRLQSLLLLLVMAAFLALLGGLLWGGAGLIWLTLIGAVLVLFNPMNSPQLIMRMYRAVPLRPGESPALYGLLQQLAQRAGLKHVPELYYLPSPMVNAFAVGQRDTSAIAVSDGLLRTLNSREGAGVLAHEISHIRSNDMWVMGLADLFSRMTAFLSLFGQILLLLNLPLIMLASVSINWWAILILILAPNLSALAQLGLSRTREYDADLNAVRLTGDAEGLASALVKIEQRQGGWLERILMPQRGTPEPSLLRTHPSTEERVRRLRALQHSFDLDGARRQPLTQLSAEVPLAKPVRRSPRRWHISGLWH
ncbi:peptidase M48 [Candidatus Tenderia electrophaga]|jgi:heat shock protein HtpX|uniref:Peptidase M48 n=1 Tax=Candidatus Tenderia electrophaga TaxID=1748243 RepID=A0A0S2TDD5_9GAMM|nr:peptidase M48 [Candidatus Tenderia electrophaga]